MQVKLCSNLFFILITSIVLALLSGLCTFSAITPRATSSQRRTKSEIDMFLRVETHNKRGNVNNLPSQSTLGRIIVPVILHECVFGESTREHDE